MWTIIREYIPTWQACLQALLTMLIAIAVYRIHAALFNWGRVKPKSRKAGSNNRDGQSIEQQDEEQANQQTDQLTGNFDQDLGTIQQRIGGNCDVHFRDFRLGGRGKRAVLMFVEGLQQEELVNKQIIERLMNENLQRFGYSASTEQFAAHIKENTLSVCKISEIDQYTELEESILIGFSALMIEGIPYAFLVEDPMPKLRAINEPTSEGLLRGPRVGFTEVLSENTAMLRQQGYTTDMELKVFEVGERVKRKLVIAYMKGIVNPDLLKEVQDRIANISIDFVADSGYVEQFIEDNWLSPFQQVQNTERPDRVINAMMEGRIGILLDGTPFALIVPVTFSMLLQSPEDYYERWIPGSLLRTLRFMVAFLALMTPALYISFISFHPGLIPTELAVTIIETRQGVPFPSLIEVLILEISIEILREAGIRLPKPVGPAMGIVGGLIIGDAAVQAGIVSPILVIVVAVTAISSFAIPTYSAGITLRLLRFAGMLFASILGMYGTILFFLMICIHLTKLKSFGVPYVTPVSPYRFSDWKDLLLRVPVTMMKSRPELLKTQDKKRKP